MSDETGAEHAHSPGENAGPTDEPASGPPVSSQTGEWDPDGVDLAKAMVARARAAGRTGPVPRSPSRKRRSTGRAGTGSGSSWSGPGTDERDPQPLESAMQKLVSEHGWEEDLSVHAVIARWDELVGTEVAAHVRPEGYAEAVLTVRADSTAWATQVRLLAGELVRRLNVAVGHGTVSRVEVLGPQSKTWSKGPRRVPGRGPRDTYG